MSKHPKSTFLVVAAVLLTLWGLIPAEAFAQRGGGGGYKPPPPPRQPTRTSPGGGSTAGSGGSSTKMAPAQVQHYRQQALAKWGGSFDRSAIKRPGLAGVGNSVSGGRVVVPPSGGKVPPGGGIAGGSGGGPKRSLKDIFQAAAGQKPGQASVGKTLPPGTLASIGRVKPPNGTVSPAAERIAKRVELAKAQKAQATQRVLHKKRLQLEQTQLSSKQRQAVQNLQSGRSLIPTGESIIADIHKLRKGRDDKSQIYEVGSEQELSTLYHKWVRGGKIVESSYPGKTVELPDGTRVFSERRGKSTGRAVVEVKTPAGEYRKVHVRDG